MNEHIAKILWKFTGGDFAAGRYSREHVWSFDGGVSVPASPSPHVVPSPWSNAANVDPEEAFVASIASCHMLTFLWLASRQRFQIESYEDDARGVMTKNERGIPWVSEVVLRPCIVWTGANRPALEQVERLHHDAHEQCFIANSIKTKVLVKSP